MLIWTKNGIGRKRMAKSSVCYETRKPFITARAMAKIKYAPECTAVPSIFFFWDKMCLGQTRKQHVHQN